MIYLADKPVYVDTSRPITPSNGAQAGDRKQSRLATELDIEYKNLAEIE